MQYFFLCCFTVIYFFGNNTVFAQTFENEDYPETQNTTLDARPDPKKQGPKHKTLRYIVKKDTKGFLPGNKCYEDATDKMGFRYIALPKGQAMYENEWERNMHNLGVKLWLLVTKGPFWKLKVNKIYRNCKYPYGDYVG